MKMPQRRTGRPSFGGIIATRQGAVVFALVCAVCATGILLFAVGRYKTNVKAPAAVTPQATVLVAVSPIAKGVSGDQIASRGLYRSVPVAATQVSSGAISDAAQLAGRETTTAILAGQQLTTQDLSPQVRIVNGLAADQRALSITMASVAGSVPLLQTGDEVDLYAQFTRGGSGGNYNVLIERGAPVLQAPASVAAATPAAAAPTTSTASSTSTSASSASGTSTSASSAIANAANGTLVLGVTTSQVSRVIFAAQNGSLYIALRPFKSNHTPSSVTNQGTVLAGALSDNSTGARP